MKAKLSLILIPLLLLVLSPLARLPAKADAQATPNMIATLHAVINPPLMSTPHPVPTPYCNPYPAPGDCPQEIPLPSLYPAPEVNKIGALEHKSCIVIPWLTLDGWKKKEICRPNR